MKLFFFYLPDPNCYRIVIDEGGIDSISSLLTHTSHKVVENSIATLLQLDSIETHSTIFSVPNRTKVAVYQKSSNITLKNLAIIFLETARNAALQPNSSKSS